MWTEIVKAVDAIDVHRPIGGAWNTSSVKMVLEVLVKLVGHKMTA
jgi:hypothetical protein